jgi:membrane-bound lytic murein transglycosylase MltF
MKTPPEGLFSFATTALAKKYVENVRRYLPDIYI